MCLKSVIIFHLNIIFYHTAWDYSKKYDIIQKHETRKQKHPKACSVFDRIQHIVIIEYLS